MDIDKWEASELSQDNFWLHVLLCLLHKLDVLFHVKGTILDDHILQWKNNTEWKIRLFHFLPHTWILDLYGNIWILDYNSSKKGMCVGLFPSCPAPSTGCIWHCMAPGGLRRINWSGYKWTLIACTYSKEVFNIFSFRQYKDTTT